MKKINLGTSDLQVTPICLGTMTFGEQVAENEAHSILNRSLDLGVNFLDTAEMYSVPSKAETFGSTERILGNWFANTPGARQKVVLATKVAGPSRGMPWVREGTGMTAQDILNSCDASLKRLQTDVIDLYQIHWPERHVPAFGMMYSILPRLPLKPPFTSNSRPWPSWSVQAKSVTLAFPTKRHTVPTSSFDWPTSMACRES